MGTDQDYKLFEDKVKERFGTIGNFFKVLGWSRGSYAVAKSRGNRRKLIRYIELFNDMKGKEVEMPVINSPFPPSLRKEIVARVKSEYRTKQNFCNKYPQFHLPEISYIENGKRKRISKKVIEICRILKIDINKYF